MASSNFFWAAELTKGNPECCWPADTPADEAEEDAMHLLEVERGVLGVSAKPNDLNIVTVTTHSSEEESMTSAPIVRLKVGGKEQCRIGLQFSSKVTFKLTSGNGPVHIMGLHEVSYNDESDDDYDVDSDNEDLSDLGLGVARPEAMKRSANGGLPPAKKQQRGMSAPADDDDDDTEDSEEESDDEMSMMAKVLGGSNDEDYDEEDDDDFEMGDDDDDDDEDDDDDDDDDDEEDESEEDSPKKAPVRKGKPQPAQGKGQQKPQQQKGQPQKPQQPQKGKPQQPPKGKPQQAQQQQQAKGGKDKEQKTPQKQQAPMNIEQMKQKLSTSPSLPKKSDKFTNYMKNTLKCTDEKVIGELWQYVQKSRK